MTLRGQDRTKEHTLQEAMQDGLTRKRRGLLAVERGILLASAVVASVIAVAWWSEVLPFGREIEFHEYVWIFFSVYAALPSFVVAVLLGRFGAHWFVFAGIVAIACISIVVWNASYSGCLDCYSDGVSIRRIRQETWPFIISGAILVSVTAVVGGLIGTAVRPLRSAR